MSQSPKSLEMGVDSHFAIIWSPYVMFEDFMDFKSPYSLGRFPSNSLSFANVDVQNLNIH